MRRKRKRRNGMSKFTAGLIGIVLIAVFSYLAYTKFANPFGHKYTIHATAFDRQISTSPTIILDGAGAVPEPATWAMMIVGLGGIGATLRRRRAATFA